jgi:hypothetical protein
MAPSRSGGCDRPRGLRSAHSAKRGQTLMSVVRFRADGGLAAGAGRRTRHGRRKARDRGGGNRVTSARQAAPCGPRMAQRQGTRTTRRASLHQSARNSFVVRMAEVREPKRPSSPRNGKRGRGGLGTSQENITGQPRGAVPSPRAAIVRRRIGAESPSCGSWSLHLLRTARLRWSQVPSGIVRLDGRRKRLGSRGRAFGPERLKCTTRRSRRSPGR